MMIKSRRNLDVSHRQLRSGWIKIRPRILTDLILGYRDAFEMKSIMHSIEVGSVLEYQPVINSGR